jgi:tRNA threonylcarbamoyladenosine biosynthesis protein TsaE
MLDPVTRNPATPLQLQLDAEAATLALGAALARSLPRAAPDALVVYLRGDLGSGKTTLARALLHALGVSGTVRSPSYTLVESYELAGLRVLHLDLYRLREPGELEQLALRDQLHAGVLLLVEWPERAPDLLPAADLDIELVISTGEGATPQLSRTANLRATSPAGRLWLARIDRS